MEISFKAKHSFIYVKTKLVNSIMSHFSYAQQYCLKKAGLALQATSAIWPGCRIGVAVSGGVDSLTLLYAMLRRQKVLPFSVEIMALHLNPGFDCSNHLHLGKWLAQSGVSSHIEITDFGPRAHSDENRKKSPCFYCAWLRRKRLFELCRQYKLSHLAIGHNADDLAATFMLNTFRNARIQGLVINESFFGGSLHMIRPLLLVEKKYILQAARQWQLPVFENACPSSGKTSRTEMEKILANICNFLPGARRSLINGLCRWQLEQERKKDQL